MQRFNPVSVTDTFLSMVFLLVIIGIYFVISTLQPGSRRKLKLVSNGGWSYVIWRVYIRRVFDSCLVLPLYQVIGLILFCLSVSTYHDLLLSSRMALRLSTKAFSTIALSKAITVAFWVLTLPKLNNQIFPRRI